MDMKAVQLSHLITAVNESRILIFTIQSADVQALVFNSEDYHDQH